MTRTDIANLALTKLGESVITDIEGTGTKAARMAHLHYDQALAEVLRAHFWGWAMSTATVAAKVNASTPATCLLSSTGVNNNILLTALASGTAAHLMSAKIDAGKTAEQEFITFEDGFLDIGVQTTTDAVNLVSMINSTTTDAYLSMVASLPETGDGTGHVASCARTYFSGGQDIVIPGWTSAFELPSDFVKLRAVYDTDGIRIDKFDLARVMGVRCLVAGDYDSVVFDYVALVDDPADHDPLFTAALVTLLASKLARAITGSESMESQLRQIYVQEDLPAARCADAQDTQSGENHPLKEMLAGALTYPRGDFFPDLDDL